MRIKLLMLAIVMSLPAACGDGTFGLDGMEGEVERSSIEGTEVFYVNNGLGVARLEADEPFESIEFHVSLADADLRALDNAGNEVVGWASVAGFIDDSSPSSHEGTLELPREATVVELRMNTRVEFARVVVGDTHGHDGEVPIPEGATTTLAAHAGRWVPPGNIVAAGNQQYLPYSGAPSRCSGTFLPGTRALAEHLKARFPGAVSYGGYNCRANTADPSKISVHGSGRAIDLFVPLWNGQADNDLGDPIANYLVANAERLGIEFIVWDRTSWGAHRAAPKHRAYGGPHPHHDHLHIELAPWAAGGGATFDKSPRGYVDATTCGGISGWAQDPDAPNAALEVYVSIGGPVFSPGAHGLWARAGEHRQDLCDAIGSCRHGWYVKMPHSLMDGRSRPVHVYAMDATGGESAELVHSGRTLKCGAPALPYTGRQAVKRHITSGHSLRAWGFQWNDIIHVSDDVLGRYQTGTPLPHSPKLRSDGPAIHVVENGTKRHVPNPRAMNAWGLNWGAVQPADLGGHAARPALEQRPYLIKGSGAAVYLLSPK